MGFYIKATKKFKKILRKLSWSHKNHERFLEKELFVHWHHLTVNEVFQQKNLFLKSDLSQSDLKKI